MLEGEVNDVFKLRWYEAWLGLCLGEPQTFCFVSSDDESDPRTRPCDFRHPLNLKRPSCFSESNSWRGTRKQGRRAAASFRLIFWTSGPGAGGAAWYNQLWRAINNKSACSARAAVLRRCGELRPSLHWKGLFIAHQSRLYQAAPPGAAQRAQGITQAVTSRVNIHSHRMICSLHLASELQALGREVIQDIHRHCKV